MNLFNSFTSKEPPILSNDQIRELLEIARKVRPWAKWYKNGQEFDELLDCLTYSDRLRSKDNGYVRSYKRSMKYYQNLTEQTVRELSKLREYYNKGKEIRKKQHSEILKLRAQVKRLQQLG